MTTKASYNFTSKIFIYAGNLSPYFHNSDQAKKLEFIPADQLKQQCQIECPERLII